MYVRPEVVEPAVLVAEMDVEVPQLRKALQNWCPNDLDPQLLKLLMVEVEGL